jgi:hypothetical protein
MNPHSDLPEWMQDQDAWAWLARQRATQYLFGLPLAIFEAPQHTLVMNHLEPVDRA